MPAGKLLTWPGTGFLGALEGLPIVLAGSLSLQPLSPVLGTDGLRAFLSLQHPPKPLSTPGCKKSLKDGTLFEFILWWSRLEQLSNLQCPLTVRCYVISKDVSMFQQLLPN